MKTNQQNNVFDITLNENFSRLEKMSRNRIGWHLRAASSVERWWLKSIKGIDPASERTIRFYTQGNNKYEFKCSNYTYDLTSGLYDDFLEAAIEVGQYLQEHFGVDGEYFYDVKVTLSYEKFSVSHTWEVIKTDNPRCALGNHKYRKDCRYLGNFNSKLVIEGYSLSGNYRRFADVLSDLVSKTIIVHSKSDAKALLRIMKFLGVQQVQIGNNQYYNSPDRRAYFSKLRYGYQLNIVDGETTICVVPQRNLPVESYEIIDIDEFIVKRSIKSRLRDRRYTWKKRKC